MTAKSFGRAGGSAAAGAGRLPCPGHFQVAAEPVACSADKRNYRAYTGTELITAPLNKAALIVQAIRIACGFDA